MDPKDQLESLKHGRDDGSDSEDTVGHEVDYDSSEDERVDKKPRIQQLVPLPFRKGGRYVQLRRAGSLWDTDADVGRPCLVENGLLDEALSGITTCVNERLDKIENNGEGYSKAVGDEFYELASALTGEVELEDIQCNHVSRLEKCYKALEKDLQSSTEPASKRIMDDLEAAWKPLNDIMNHLSVNDAAQSDKGSESTSTWIRHLDMQEHPQHRTRFEVVFDPKTRLIERKIVLMTDGVGAPQSLENPVVGSELFSVYTPPSAASDEQTKSSALDRDGSVLVTAPGSTVGGTLSIHDLEGQQPL